MYSLKRKTRKRVKKHQTKKQRHKCKYRGGMFSMSSGFGAPAPTGWGAPTPTGWAAPAAPAESKNEPMYSDPTVGTKGGHPSFPERINNLPVINYVISSHGATAVISPLSGLPHAFVVPINTEIVFYNEHGNLLYCEKKKQTSVCSGTEESTVYERFTSGMPCVNYQLTKDQHGSFKSGAVDCSIRPNQIVFNLDTFQHRSSGLKYIIDEISRYHARNHPETFSRIHCLFCRSS